MINVHFNTCLDPPYFVNTKENQYVVIGEDGIITCEARGEGDLLISWHKEGEGLEVKFATFVNKIAIKYIAGYMFFDCNNKTVFV